MDNINRDNNKKEIEIKITGEPEMGEGTIIKINEIIADQEDIQSKMERKRDEIKNEICSFHETRTCKYGQNCFRIHKENNPRQGKRMIRSVFCIAMKPFLIDTFSTLS